VAAVVDVGVLRLMAVVLEIMLGMERLVLSIPVAVGVALVVQRTLTLLPAAQAALALLSLKYLTT
jgi:hypothetical protein